MAGASASAIPSTPAWWWSPTARPKPPPACGGGPPPLPAPAPRAPPAPATPPRTRHRRKAEPVDASLLRRRIAQAIAYRRHHYPPGESCRLVFSEGDWLPGLTVDRYGSCLAVQIATLGMDRLRDDITAGLQDAVHPRGIYERSDLPTRLREGLEARTALLSGEGPDAIEVVLDELRFLVRLRSGRKTGLYLDHRFN